MGKAFKFIIGVLTFAVIIGMATIVFFLTREGELPEIDGREEILADKVKKVNLFDRMELAFNNKEDFILTEEELNHYLAEQADFSQGGQLAQYFEVTGMWADITENWVTFYLEREVVIGMGDDEQGKPKEPYKQRHVTKFGFEITTIEHEDSSIEKIIAQGSGKVGGMPALGLFGMLAKGPIIEVGQTFKDEMDLFKKMAKITVSDGKIELSPSANTIVLGASSEKR